jgi:GT2 family glycosyltransferase
VPPEVSVIVVSWNGREYLGPCLDALRAQRGIDFEVILVDNASTDGTSEFVRTHYPGVRMVELPHNLGFAGGNNAGARDARAPWLAFLNNDTVPEPDWLARLHAGVRSNTHFQLATSRIVYMHDATVVDSAGDGMYRSGGAFKRHHGGRADDARASGEVFGICGAACLIERSVFEELGGFDEHFFASHEDVDLSYRARLRGYRCAYVADAVVRHHGSATLGTVSAFSVYQGQRNLEWVYLKNTPGSLLLRTLPGHLLYLAAAALFFARQGRLTPFVRAKASAVAALPRVWRQRHDIQRSRRVGAEAIEPHLSRGWLSAKLREKRFDVDLAAGTR